MTTPLVVAEIGGNHAGSLATATRMVEIAAGYCSELFDERARVAVKFQKRTPRLRPQDFRRPHPNPFHAYGPTYGAHREALEFDREQHAKLKATCETLGATYACSVWDIPAAEDIASLSPAWIKVPSAHNQDWPLLEWLADWGGSLHVSLGMTTREEADALVDFLAKTGAAERTILYHCTSAYPVAAEDVRLDELAKIRERYQGTVQGFGFSGHHHGIAIDMGAVMLGAQYIERHFTLNRTWKGTDHAASLEPDGLRKLIRGVRDVSLARGDKGATGLIEAEHGQRMKLKMLTQEAA